MLAGKPHVSPLLAETSDPRMGARPLPTARASLADQYLSRHTVVIGGRELSYQATVGTIGIDSKAGAPRAELSFVAYEGLDVRGERSGQRPVTFLFNGGPGSSSMWLLLGSFGPVRLDTGAPDGHGASRFAPNPYSLLDMSDLVFIDAVGTGRSRAFDQNDAKRYWGNDQDAAAFADAIEHWLSATGRWRSPKFLFGESYGTMRAANLAPILHQRGIDLAGIVMMSTILNFGHFAPGLDQAAIDLLPSFAVTAAYHGKATMPPGGPRLLARQARTFARGPYAAALAQGDRLPIDELRAIAEQMHALIGLPAAYIEAANLRVGIDQFRRELLRVEGRSIGSLDTRYTGAEKDRVGEQATYDPAEAALAGPYTATLNDYLTRELGYAGDQPYVTMDQRRIMAAWDWSHQPPEGERQNSLADSVIDLAVAMHQQPDLKILALNGYYDLQTPFFGAEFDLARVGRKAVDRAELRYYPSGHMIYVDDRIMPELRSDIANFYDAVLAGRHRD